MREEPGSTTSNSSEESPSNVPLYVDGRPLAPGEQYIVHKSKGLVLTKVNFKTHDVIPFKDSFQTYQEREFHEYRIVEGPHGEKFERFLVKPDQWLKDIYSYSCESKNRWIYLRAYRVYEEHVEDEKLRKVEEDQRRLQEYRIQLTAYVNRSKGRF
ncbi:uncharacterized protein LOC117173107 isoform X2 [Belonocnema kinseyi]|uniref:uncharacterized protein LOC117173107 isoform X2 n=1 Tax=Belonocnema kinseyi TaxID=2817044 RepID=UPI00143D3421|nr:uncharacterized protein LOC117173107 isoform X2 [Belonocnema kinseyi]